MERKNDEQKYAHYSSQRAAFNAKCQVKTFLSELRLKATKMKSQIATQESKASLAGFLDALFAEDGWYHETCIIPKDLAGASG